MPALHVCRAALAAPGWASLMPPFDINPIHPAQGRTGHEAAAIHPANVGLGAPGPAQRGGLAQALHAHVPHGARAVQRGAQRNLARAV